MKFVPLILLFFVFSFYSCSTVNTNIVKDTVEEIPAEQGELKFTDLYVQKEIPGEEIGLPKDYLILNFRSEQLEDISKISLFVGEKNISKDFKFNILNKIQLIDCLNDSGELQSLLVKFEKGSKKYEQIFYFIPRKEDIYLPESIE